MGLIWANCFAGVDFTAFADLGKLLRGGGLRRLWRAERKADHAVQPAGHSALCGAPYGGWVHRASARPPVS